MINAIAILLLCQLTGETLARGLELPVPGPVLGLLIMLGGFLVMGRLGRLTPKTINDTAVGHTTNGLLQNLTILFIPAGVGVIERLDVFSNYGVALATALIVSTLLALIVTALVFVGVKRLQNGWTR